MKCSRGLRCKGLGFTCSMSGSGNVRDNSAMESFFSSLKTGRTARKKYRTRDETRSEVFGYIERFYNPVRRHSTLGGFSPIQYEEQGQLAYGGVHETGSSPAVPKRFLRFCRPLWRRGIVLRRGTRKPYTR